MLKICAKLETRKIQIMIQLDRVYYNWIPQPVHQQECLIIRSESQRSFTICMEFWVDFETKGKGVITHLLVFQQCTMIPIFPFFVLKLSNKLTKLIAVHMSCETGFYCCNFYSSQRCQENQVLFQKNFFTKIPN